MKIEFLQLLLQLVQFQRRILDHALALFQRPRIGAHLTQVLRPLLDFQFFPYLPPYCVLYIVNIGALVVLWPSEHGGRYHLGHAGAGPALPLWRWRCGVTTTPRKRLALLSYEERRKGGSWCVSLVGEFCRKAPSSSLLLLEEIIRGYVNEVLLLLVAVASLVLCCGSPG